MVMVTLKGLAHEYQNTRGGLYNMINNSSRLYYVKQVSRGEDQAMWPINGAWAIGPLDDVGTESYGLTTAQPFDCPYAEGVQWQVWDGTKLVEVEDTVKATEWTQGKGCTNHLISNRFTTEPFFPETCPDKISVSMTGRVYQEHSKRTGIYEKQMNESYPYWVKNDTALWLDQEFGNWKIGSLENVGSSTASLKSDYLTLCPESSSVGWQAYYNGEWNEVYNHMNVTGILKSATSGPSLFSDRVPK